MSREEKIRAVAAARHAGVRLVLEDIHDPHNAAAILRTCDALGIQEAWFVFSVEKRYNPRKVGKVSSSSANKWLTFRVFDSTRACFDALAKDEYASLGSVLDTDKTLDAYPVERHARMALWVGNEHRGLSEDARGGVDALVRFPMRGMVESLNVSVAAAVMLADIVRRREAAHLGTMSAPMIETLAADLSVR